MCKTVMKYLKKIVKGITTSNYSQKNMLAQCQRYAAVRSELRNPDPDLLKLTGYSCPGKRSHQFSFSALLFCFRVRSQYGMDGQNL